jgi:hypothetical protein
MPTHTRRHFLAGPNFKPWNAQSVKVNLFEANFHGTNYYYYEDAASGTFISARKNRKAKK